MDCGPPGGRKAGLWGGLEARGVCWAGGAGLGQLASQQAIAVIIGAHLVNQNALHLIWLLSFIKTTEVTNFLVAKGKGEGARPPIKR